MWAIYPFNEMDTTIRVNQLIDGNATPPVYFPPRIEISIFWLTSTCQVNGIQCALDKAKEVLSEWQYRTGTNIYG
jgi:hypothetical protein